MRPFAAGNATAYLKKSAPSIPSSISIGGEAAPNADKAAEVLHNGDFVTVDGHLGSVTVGSAEFDLELQLKPVSKGR